MPWRGSRDPYRIWIAEVMLQQTRAATVARHYARFLERFPDVGTLAAAARPEVLLAWAGLGYYRRAHQLHEAARLIVKAGAFPRDASGWRALPGVGEYAAAAIASIAFGEPVPALDSNAVRVLSRLLAERGCVGTAGTRRRLANAARLLLDPGDPGRFNQALMDLGATICVARAPQCDRCPLARHCLARRHGIEKELPRLRPRPPRVPVRQTLLWVERDGALLLRRLPAGRLQGFWELPSHGEIPGARVEGSLVEVRHSITRYDYRIQVLRALVDQAPQGCRWVTGEELERLPLSTVTRKALVALGRWRSGHDVGKPVR
ncbi:MAG: NUDIX domain-containing protein [Bryobacterales bacterium]|nr:NUDIX domain-containing protein [Bryobacterales bacterium]